MYEKMYTILFDAITRALKDLDENDIGIAKWRLSDAQREAESLFLDWDWEHGGERGGPLRQEEDPDAPS